MEDLDATKTTQGHHPGSQSFAERTLPHTVPWFPGHCYQWNPATCQDSGCEHFGSWTYGGGGGCQNQGRGQKHGSGNIEPTTRSIVRRIELYAFTGDYDPTTNEALCADPTCNAPSEGEVGELISTQMTAVNLQSNSVAVTMILNGKGSVDSDDTLIKCGNNCVASYDEGAVVTLTAHPASNAVFTSWAGACQGNGPTCTVSANGHVQVWAAFVATGGGGVRGTPSCGLLGIEGLLPFAWFAWRRRSQRS